MRIVYLLGVAGTGKTTLARTLTADWRHRLDVDQPVAHQHWLSDDYGRVITLGRPHPVFAGTDTLSFTAIEKLPTLLARARDHDVKLVIGEGDRLANQRFVDLARANGTLLLFYLTAPDHVLDARRTARATQHGLTPQSPQWLKGRLTKHQRLARANGAAYLNALQPPTTLATQIHDHLRLCHHDRASTASN